MVHEQLSLPPSCRPIIANDNHDDIDTPHPPPFSNCFPPLHCFFCYNSPSLPSSPTGSPSNSSRYESRPPRVVVSAPRTEEEVLSSSRLMRFSYRDLKIATQNFEPGNLLGEGGFGHVFKGRIGNWKNSDCKIGEGEVVAVKILNPDGLQGHREWLTEVDFLSEVHHRHLVKLVGFCIEAEQRLLVYEFMEMGNLETHLFLCRGHTPLSWHIRMKIAWGAAMGLAFLHGWKRPIIFRDFKASNILLDADFNAKLSDFGLARDGPKGDKTHVSTRVMGTYGYAAPEYVMTGHLTTRSDVYSFGVVLLEILTGKPSVDERRPQGQQKLVEWALPLLSDQRKVIRLVDPRLNGNYSMRGVKQAAKLALRCLSSDPKARPTMQEISKILYALQNLKCSAPHRRV